MKVAGSLWEKLRNNIFPKKPEPQREKAGKGPPGRAALEPVAKS